MLFRIKKRLIAVITYTCLVSSPGFTQADVLQKPDILPPTPEIAAFGKNIAIPMSYVSGTPQINIPIYSVRSGVVEVPISLSYNASGIRVEEVPTWVGLGWNLNAGGMITRTVRGRPDDTPDWGYMNPHPVWTLKYIDSAHCRCSEDSYTWYINEQLEAGFPDVEPDAYTFSVMGYSGEFYWHQDSAKFILVPFQNIQISGGLGNFVLTLPNGIRATFGCAGNDCEDATESGYTYSYVDGSIEAPTAITPQSNGWVLSELADPTGRKIEFFYSVERSINFSRGGERFGTTYSDLTNAMRRQSFIKQYNKRPMLQRISGELVDIYFKRSSSARLDMPDYWGGARALDTIVIKNKYGTEIRSFYFRYGYDVSPTYSTLGILGISEYAEEARRRLVLQSVTEKVGTDSLPPYEFTYHPTALPSRFSTSQDYWGYYNGRSNGVYLMPRIPDLSFNVAVPDYNEINGILPNYGSYLTTAGADRRIDSNFTQARILTKIKYPTGGETEYFYEQNNASNLYLNIYGGIEPPDMIEKAYTLSILSSPIPDSPPYPLSFTGTFSISRPATKVKIIPTLPTCTTYTDASCKLSVQIKSLPGMSVVASFATTSVLNIQLDEGSYQVEVVSTASSNDPPLNFSIGILWGERADTENFLVGGVRAKRIVSRDGLGGRIVRALDYSFPTGQSSGILEGCPVHTVLETGSSGLIFLRRYFSSNSVMPLTSDGRTVSYQFVTEYADSARTSFKTEYSFTAGQFNRDKFAKARLGIPLIHRNWQSGLLERKRSYERSAPGTYRLLEDEQYYFQYHRPLQYFAGLWGRFILQYDIASEWYLPDSSITIRYTYPNGIQTAMQTTSKTFYNGHFLPGKTRSYNSKGQIVISNTWYPGDFNNPSGYSIPALKASFIINVPIRHETSVNGKIVAGSVLKYSPQGQPIEGYNYENYTTADTTAHSVNTVTKTQHKLQRKIYYSANGTASLVEGVGSDKTAYLWNSSGTYPIAQVVNADTTLIAYTSFESDGHARWSVIGGIFQADQTAPTGKNGYALTGATITRNGLAAKTYIVSYWKRDFFGGTVSVNGSSATVGNSGDGWTYYQHKVTNPGSGTITVTGTAVIDELRLYPETAQMTSFSVEPLIGITSQCDANNNILKYEYDGLNRLSLVRNSKREIIKKICYNYAGQPIDCGVGSGAYWQAISTVCEQVEGVNTGNLLVTEKDMNPTSEGYGDTRTVTIEGGCVLPSCNPGSCAGDDKKCINGVCETGVRVNTGSVRLTQTTWRCYYHYVFSDNSISGSFDEIVGLGGCPLL